MNVLVLQGGGALGAYQAGAFDILAAQSKGIDWVAGISIGAINSALIAGNPPERRVERLHAFWDRVTLHPPLPPPEGAIAPVRGVWDNMMALWGVSFGVHGFFSPRPPTAWWLHTPSSYYDTSPLRATLLELVDFDYLNDGPVRFSVGSVDVETGNLTYFDNRREVIAPEHVMASGALPPGFPAVEVDGQHYWDGGVVSNTPLAYVMRHVDAEKADALNVFQVDLFCARGKMPDSMAAVGERQKDIQYSSRTRLVSDLVRERYALHKRIHDLSDILTPEQRKDARVHALLEDTDNLPMMLVHLIHRHKSSENQTKDFEFSRMSMLDHWSAGRADMEASLQLLAKQKPLGRGEFRVLDHAPDAHAARVLSPRTRPSAKATGK